MNQKSLTVEYSSKDGITISLDAGKGVQLDNVPVRVRVLGEYVFRVWSRVHSGEGPAKWAEPDLDLTFFGPEKESAGMKHSIERFEGGNGAIGYKVSGRHERGEITMLLGWNGAELETSVSVTNAQGLGGESLPLSALELTIDEMILGPDAVYESAHAYGGRTHGFGSIAKLEDQGVPFIHGCIGLAFPLVCLHNPRENRGLRFEFMMDGRPTAWLRRGSMPDSARRSPPLSVAAVCLQIAGRGDQRRSRRLLLRA